MRTIPIIPAKPLRSGGAHSHRVRRPKAESFRRAPPFCADPSAMLFKVMDALIQTTAKARFCKTHAALLGRASKGCLRGFYTSNRGACLSSKKVRPALGGEHGTVSKINEL